jgi:hypothetical protein
VIENELQAEIRRISPQLRLGPDGSSLDRNPTGGIIFYGAQNGASRTFGRIIDG